MKPLIKTFQFLFALVCATALGWTLAQHRQATPAPLATATHEHTGPTLEKVRELSELVTLTVEVADVQQTRIEGRVGGICAILAVRGDVQVGVDLTAARFEQLDRQRRTAVLMLPEPVASRPRLDHERSRLFGVRSDGLWAITPGDRMYGVVTERAWAEAQRNVGAALDAALIERGRVRAEHVLQTYCGAIGWQVEIRWPGRP